MASLDIRPLTACDIGPAYALIGLAQPELSLADWRARAARWMRPPSPAVSEGVMTARRPAGALCGLVVYHLAPGAPGLHVERLIAFDLTDPERVARALTDAVLASTGLTAGDLVVHGPASPHDDPISRLLQSPATALHRVL